jgi:hypothetical protein
VFDCPAGKICTGNQCVDCTTNGDCTAATQYGAGYRCCSGKCKQKQECCVDADCAGNPHGVQCRTTAGVCGCGNYLDCPNTLNVCVSNICQACTTNAQCRAGNRGSTY